LTKSVSLIWGLGERLQLLTKKNQQVTECTIGPQTWYTFKNNPSSGK